ncbi:MAG: 30S ribosomal protein S6 [Alphaproteobacteria bacterium]|nr:30S ribosomal protein S6 [Alphaproteobacteria bacterium]
MTASQVEGITADFSKIIEENEGKVAKTEYWGLKNLAYKIKKNRKGHYILMNIDAPHAAVAEMERQARLHDDVLRFMTIRVDELEEGQSIVLRSKADKERRAPRGEGRGDKREAR